MMKYFEVNYLPQAAKFLRGLDSKAARKVLYNISKAQLTRDSSVFKKLRGTELWEFKANIAGIQYRLFAFWDDTQEALVICTHGIIKKSQKTPQQEIDKAEKIRKQYLGL